MRSEVVNLTRRYSGVVIPADPNCYASGVLSDIVGSMIRLGETKSVRISAEIVEEKGEEKVSVVTLEKDTDGKSLLWIGTFRYWYPGLDRIVKDWKTGESSKVKSIQCDTPSGVPVVEFVETPRERLKRERYEIVHANNERKVSDLEASASLIKSIDTYLAATEGEK